MCQTGTVPLCQKGLAPFDTKGLSPFDTLNLSPYEILRQIMSKKNINNYIHPSERLDDLQRNGYVLIQDPSLFCFGMDAVLLADFARAGKKDHVLDLCTGNGVIPLLMAARGKGGMYTGIELQEKSADLAGRNARVNDTENIFKVIQGDICNTRELLKENARPPADVVTCNPPYMAGGDGLVNPEDEKALARHEISCTFADIAGQAAGALKDGGHFFLVHRPRRIVEIIRELEGNALEPKRMRFVHSFAGKEATMVLIDAVKKGGAQMIVEPPLVIYDAVGEYTREVREMY